MKSYSTYQIVCLALVIGFGRSQGTSTVDRVNEGDAEKNTRLLRSAQRSLDPVTGMHQNMQQGTAPRDVAEFWDRFLSTVVTSETSSMSMTASPTPATPVPTTPVPTTPPPTTPVPTTPPPTTPVPTTPVPTTAPPTTPVPTTGPPTTPVPTTPPPTTPVPTTPPPTTPVPTTPPPTTPVPTTPPPTTPVPTTPVPTTPPPTTPVPTTPPPTTPVPTTPPPTTPVPTTPPPTTPVPTTPPPTTPVPTTPVPTTPVPTTPPPTTPVPTTPPPSTPPSLQPTPCLLNVTLECIGCDVNSSITDCQQRPFMMGFLLRGGNCSENNFSQPLEQVTCVDYPQNGDVPKQGSEETIYIRVNRDPGDKGDGDDFPSLFDDYVQQGTNYYVYTGNSSIDLPPDTQIRIYKNENKTDANILQDVRFHASCSSPLLLNNVFGASQLIQFENNLQGNVSLTSSTLTTFNISIPIGYPIGSETLNITFATIRTNYTDPLLNDLPIIGELICSEDVANDPNEPCNQTAIEVEFETTLDLGVSQGYFQEVIVTATGVETGVNCRGQDSFEFYVQGVEGPV